MVARICVKVIDGRRVISVAGDLRSGDLGRLEHACGAALEHPCIAVDIWLARDVTFDESALAFLDALACRGATIATVDRTLEPEPPSRQTRGPLRRERKRT